MSWAQRGRLQSFYRFTSTFKVFNNLGNLLFARRQPKSAQREGFCHGFATVRLYSSVRSIVENANVPTAHEAVEATFPRWGIALGIWVGAPSWLLRRIFASSKGSMQSIRKCA